MNLSAAIEALLLATRANGRSPQTVKAYAEKLSYLLDALGDVPVETITVHELRRYVSAQLARSDAGELSPFTVAGRVRALKRLFSFLVDEEVLTANPARRIHTTKPRNKTPKGILREDIRRLLETTLEGGLMDLRDRAVILLLTDTGCRVGGLCGLRLGDLDLSAGQAWVTEKGEKTRLVFLCPLTLAALRDWLAVRPTVETDALFLNLDRSKRLNKPLSPVAVARMLARRGERAGIEGKVNPHSFRHAFARDYLMSGGDLASLSDLLGHSDVQVTKMFYGVLTGEELRHKHAQHSPVKRLTEEIEGGSNGNDSASL